jgi:UDP-3-O-[3-hydroxymyristoyl] glucosamine N-acyltransferase
MTVINSVDFDKVVDDAINAAKAVITSNWDQVRDIVENISRGLTNDVSFIANKKASGEFNENDARVYLEDQKIVARVRLRSIAIITLQIAERIWNAIAEVFRAAINKAIGWTLL